MVASCSAAGPSWICTIVEAGAGLKQLQGSEILRFLLNRQMSARCMGVPILWSPGSMVVDPCLPFKGTQNGNGYNKRKVAETCGNIFARVLPRLCCSVTIGAEHPSCDESHGSCRAACLNIVFVQRVFKTAGSDRAHSISDTVIITQCIWSWTAIKAVWFEWWSYSDNSIFFSQDDLLAGQESKESQQGPPFRIEPQGSSLAQLFI